MMILTFRTEDVAPVNRVVPQIHLTGIGAQMSFVVDSSRMPSSEIGNDNLGVLPSQIFPLNFRSPCGEL